MTSGLILMIDDNPGDVRLAMEALRDNPLFGMLAVAGDGVEGMECLHGGGKLAHLPKPDLILLDLNLPRKDGFEVLAEIKADPELAGIPVVVLTSSDEPEDMQRTRELKADSYLTKSPRLEEFIATLNTAVDYWLGAPFYRAGAEMTQGSGCGDLSQAEPPAPLGRELAGMASISERV